MLFSEFDDVQFKLELANEGDEEERVEVEDSFCQAIAQAKELLRGDCPILSQNTIRVNNQADNVRYPIINLPIFDGNIENWLQFRDTFDSLINVKSRFSPIEKFHYLRSSLRKEALQVIQSLETTASNYAEAWNLLKARFENKKLIVHSHIKSLFELPVITKASADSLRQLLDNLQKHIRALKSLGEPVDKWNTVVIYLVNTKFDNATKIEWESVNKGENLPTYDEFIAFLENRYRILETIEVNKASTPKPSNSFSKSNSKGDQYAFTT